MELQPTPELNKALAKAKADFPKILENKRVKILTKAGREINFSYAELDEIADAVTPSLSGYGLVLASQTLFVEGRFCLMTTLRHESGEVLASYFPLPCDQDCDPKDMGAKISYGRRYNIICLLEINTIEPSNPEQRNQQIQKLAKDLKSEVGIATKPQAIPAKRGDTSFIDAVNGYVPKQAIDKKSTAVQDLYPGNNNIIRQVRSHTKHDADWIFAQCKHLGYDRPGMMPPEVLEKLVEEICTDWAVGAGVVAQRQQAVTSIQETLFNANVAGQPILGAALDWLRQHNSHLH